MWKEVTKCMRLVQTPLLAEVEVCVSLPLLLLHLGNLALHLTSLWGSLWFPCPGPPVMLRVEVLLSLAALVFLFNMVR